MLISYLLIFLVLVSAIITFLLLTNFLTLIYTRGVPFVSSPQKKFDAILQAVEIKPEEKIYDLGCGKAHLLIRAAKEYQAKGLGYEVSLWPYLWARLNVWLSGADVRIKMANFFKADLSDADVIYCYLFPSVMAKLESKFKKEMKPGSRVVTYAFKLPNLEPAKVISTNSQNGNQGKIFVYKF